MLLARPAAALGTAAAAVALMVTGLGLAYGLWLWAHINLPLAALLLSPLLGGGLRIAAQARQELQERGYLHQVLARRISPTLLNDILRKANDSDASDIHLVAGHAPMVRAQTVMTPLDMPILSAEDMWRVLASITNEHSDFFGGLDEHGGLSHCYRSMTMTKSI